MSERSSQSLNSIPSGERGVVTELKGGVAFRNRITSMGLTVGSPIHVLQTSRGLAGPTLLATGDTRLAIGQGMAENIMIAIETTETSDPSSDAASDETDGS